MEILLSLIAVALPVLLGGLWINPFVPAQNAGRTALVWGNGALLGLLLVPQLMVGLDALEIPLTFRSTASLIGALLALALTVQLFKGKRPQVSHNPALHYSGLPKAHKALFIFLLALILLRVATLGLEVLWRPLFPWDATMHWATKARVWYELNSIAPFVEHWEWLEVGGKGVFTDAHANYPAAIPLLQVWMNLTLGQWNPSLMNLPWLLCLIALGTAFYGQLRVCGVGPLIAMAFSYLLLSMPLLNIHVALAGYADLFLGAAYCAGLMAWYGWATTRQHWQAMLTAFFAISCTLIKDEGLVWALTFIPALAVTFMARRDAAKLYVLCALVLVLLWILVPLDMEVAGHTVEALMPEFRPHGLLGIVQSIWLHNNLHLLGYLLLAIIPLGLMMPGAMTRTYLALTVALGTAVMAFMFLFLFTGFGVAATDFTGVGRLSIQLAPGLLYFIALLCNELLTRDSLKPAPQENTTVG